MSLKIMLFSDIHWQYPNFPQSDFPPCDIALFAGDWSGRGTESESRAFASWYATLPAKNKIAIPGNHERHCYAYPDLTRSIFQEHGITLLIDDFITVSGINIYGTPWCPGFGDWSWAYLASETHLHEIFSKIPCDTDILMTHCPPAWSLDDGFGSTALEDVLFTRSHRPSVHVFGHVHGAHGHSLVNDTYNYNASVLDDDYNIAWKPTIIEFEKSPGGGNHEHSITDSADSDRS